MGLLLMRRWGSNNFIIRWLGCIRMLGKCRKICDCLTFIIEVYREGGKIERVEYENDILGVSVNKNEKSAFLKNVIRKI